MKKHTYAALLAAALLLSTAGCAKQPTTADAPAQETQVQDTVPEQAHQPQQEKAQPRPETAGTEDSASAGVWLDEPETMQLDLEETVSCSYTLPHLTLASDSASAAANAVFETLSDNIVAYAQETVYSAAQEKQAMGFVNGSYSIESTDSVLTIHYTISVSYSTQSADTQITHDFSIDLTNGELLEED